MVDSKTHLMTVDVEDWFQVFYGESLISKEEWNQQESKIEQMLEALLELFEHHQIKATFFVVGWLAEKKPSLIRKLHEVGHEIASHSYWHQPVFQLSQTAFSEDITRAKQVLEQAIGHQVYGFRAPGYSIDSKNPWALDEIIKAGYLYDSSLLHQPLQFCEMSPGFFEISPNALKLGSSYLPINGGFVFRCLPYFIYWIYIQWVHDRLPLTHNLLNR